MEKVLEDKDLFLYIIENVPSIFKLKLKEINKTFYENMKFIENELECQVCFSKKIFLPIQIENKLYCYDCYNNNCVITCNFIDSHSITKEDKEKWYLLEKSQRTHKSKKIFIRCKYCNLKCFGNEWCYYHLEKRCDIYYDFRRDLKEESLNINFSYIID
jgi:hypothetical protein